MKRFLFISFMLLGIGQTASFAQQGNTDDIYFNSSDLEKQKKEDKQKAEQEAAQRRYDEQNSYSSSGGDDASYSGSKNYNKSYEADGYADYSNSDDYYYATRIRHFNYPFYNVGYYNSFYNPFGYDPYWYDPYWGWSWWNRPTFSITIGTGPYWSSYWGWHTWYGYGGFGSFWNYPVYANWYGGNYYSGFWNGYYAGLYGNDGYGRNISYGPRNSTNAAYNVGVRNANGIRETRSPLNSSTPASSTEGRRGARMANPDNTAVERPNRNTGAMQSDVERNTRYNTDRPANTGAGNDGRNATFDRPARVNEDRPARGSFSPGQALPDNAREQPVERDSRPVYENNRIPERSGSYERPRQETPSNTQRQRIFTPRNSSPAPNYERNTTPTPRYERSQPSYTPSRSVPSSSPAPSRSSGGFEGGRRR